MQVQVNDESVRLDGETTLAAALKAAGFGEEGFAVAVNMTFVPRSQQADFSLKDGDRIEVVTPMQGG